MNKLEKKKKKFSRQTMNMFHPMIHVLISSKTNITHLYDDDDGNYIVLSPRL